MRAIYSALLISLYFGASGVALAETLSGPLWKIDAAPPGPYRPSSPFRPSAPSRPSVPFNPSSPQKSGPTEIRYSQSAQAANMIMPAIWLGMPTLFIIALIIRAMKGD